MKTFLLSIAFLIPGVVMAQDPGFEKAEFRDGKDVLPYRILKPLHTEKEKKVPLVLVLHGAGERGMDNTAQLVHGSALFLDPKNREKFPCFVLFPQCPPGKRWVEVDWGQKTSHAQPKEPSDPMRLTRHLLDQLLSKEPIDEKRIYITGLSMGGFGTWDFAARYPDLTAAIAPICGGADDSTAPRLKDIPVWAFHGAKDTAVWPERSRSMIQALRKTGATPRYTEYEKVGHDSWNNAFREPEFLPWLFSHVKK